MLHSYEITDDEIEAAASVTQPYLEYINETPLLLSLLYDIDLLPEQITLFVNAKRMVAVCELFKIAPLGKIEEAFT